MPRQRLQPIGVVGGVPEAGQQFTTLSRLAGRLGAAVGKELDEAAVKFGTEKGKQSFLDGTFKERTGTGIFSKAYNASGIVANAAAAKTLMNAKVAEMAATHEFDVEAFEQAAKEFSPDLSSTMDASVRDTGLIEYNNLVQQTSSVLREKAIGRERESQKRTLLVQLNKTKDDALRMVRQGNVSGALLAQEEVKHWLAAARPLGVSEGEALAISTELERGMLMAATLGDVDRAVVANNGFVALGTLIANRDKQGTFSPDEYQKLENYARTAALQHYANLDRIRVQSERATEDLEDANFKRLRTKVLAGGSITDELQGAVLSDTQFALLQDLDFKLGTEGRDDVQLRNTFLSTIASDGLPLETMQDQLLTAFQGGRLSRKTYGELVTAAEQELGTASTDFKNAQREMLVLLKFDPSSINLGLMTDDDSKLVSTAMRMFRKMVTEEGVDPDVASGKVAGLLSTTKQLIKPVTKERPRMSPAQAEAAFMANDITETERNFILIEHRRHDRVEADRASNKGGASSVPDAPTDSNEQDVLARMRANAAARGRSSQ